MGNFQKIRRIFRIRNRNDPERLPLFLPSTSRQRSPSISSTSTNSSSSSTHTRSPFRGYGSLFTSLNILRNPFRRSGSSQVRESNKTICDMRKCVSVSVSTVNMRMFPFLFYLLTVIAHVPLMVSDLTRLFE